MKCNWHTDLENAIWKQLPFSHDHSIFNKKTWRDFVLYVKESGNAFSTIIEPTWIMSDVGKKMLQMFLVFYAKLLTYIKKEEIPLYTLFHMWLEEV